tara:strand:- start:2003 stop:2911 length:909 start_codon:yes stop_codon:yes gene_type:complete
MFEFYSPGKLLITGEYFVLSGATAFALPTFKGQRMQVIQIENPVLKWKSYTNSQEIWINTTLSLVDFECVESSNTPLPLIQKLQKILRCIRLMQPHFCSSGFEVITQLEFDRNWGFGSSSTLINNLAQWAVVNPYKLLDLTIGGSGYDIAVAQAKKPILFTRNQYSPSIEPLEFNPDFINELYLVYLNQKQDSQKEVTAYKKRKQPKLEQIDQISQISLALTNSNSLKDFNKLLLTHERLVGTILDKEPIQKRLFPDFNGQIKSLGAWGGDFILATGSTSISYFKKKGFSTILSYNDIISTK